MLYYYIPPVKIRRREDNFFYNSRTHQTEEFFGIYPQEKKYSVAKPIETVVRVG